jgi:hypothetical protein
MLRSMKNLSGIIILLLLCLVNRFYAQQLSPSVIASSGDLYSGNAGTLSFTTGEIAAITTLSGSAGILTQGFQQPWDLGTYITEHPDQHFSFGLYPNPSDGRFYILTEAEPSLQLDIWITDLLGQPVLQFRTEQLSKIQATSMDISDHPQGTYILSLRIKALSANPEKIYNTKITIVK